MSRIRAAFYRLALLVMSFGMVFLAAEVALRVLTPASDARLFRYTTETPRLKIMRKGDLGTIYGVPFHTNELGFRDDCDVVTQKQENEIRIIVLGDSFTASAGVPFQEIFTSQLEAALSEKTDAPVSVMNLSVGGYNIVRYEMVLEEVGFSLEPDAIVVAVYLPNDFQPNDDVGDRRLAESGDPAGRPASDVSSYLDWRNSKLLWVIGPDLKALAYAALYILQGRPDDGFNRTQAKVPPVVTLEPAWEANSAALLRISERGEAEGIPVLVLLLPAVANFSAQVASHDRLMDLCRAQELNCVDTLPGFIQSNRMPRFYRVQLIDGHPNAAYNRVVSAAAAEAIAIHREPGTGSGGDAAAGPTPVLEIIAGRPHS